MAHAFGIDKRSAHAARPLALLLQQEDVDIFVAQTDRRAQSRRPSSHHDGALQRFSPAKLTRNQGSFRAVRYESPASRAAALSSSGTKARRTERGPSWRTTWFPNTRLAAVTASNEPRV